MELESNSPHAITDHLSDVGTLAVADSTTPEVDRNFKKYGYSQKRMSWVSLSEPTQISGDATVIVWDKYTYLWPVMFIVQHIASYIIILDHPHIGFLKITQSSFKPCPSDSEIVFYSKGHMFLYTFGFTNHTLNLG